MGAVYVGVCERVGVAGVCGCAGVFTGRVDAADDVCRGVDPA